MTIDQAQLDHWTRLASEATEPPWIDDLGTVHLGHGWISVIHNRDAAFIAAARTAVPELIAEVVVLREELRIAHAYMPKPPILETTRSRGPHDAPSSKPREP